LQCNIHWTNRKLKTRTKHKNHIRRKTDTEWHSVITKHRLNCNHDFDWENVTILDKEKFLMKRLISEMLHIKRQSSLNLQSDTEYLHHAYVAILDKIWLSMTFSLSVSMLFIYLFCTLLSLRSLTYIILTSDVDYVL